MRSTPPATGAGEVWLIHLSSTPPEHDTIAKVGSADVRRSSTLTVVVGQDDLTIQLLEPQDLSRGQFAKVGLDHVKAAAVALADILATAPGPVVLAAVDRVARLASWDVVQELDHVIATDTLDAAIKVVAMMRAGADVDEVLHPPGFSVALSVADAGIGRPADAETLVTVDQGSVTPDSAWLTIHDQDLEIRTLGMGRSAVRAVTARAGCRRRVVEDVPRRLVLGPANYAGQGGAWARAVREHAPGWTARNLQVVPPHALVMFDADLPLTSVEWSDPATRLDLAVELVVGATDIVVEAMRPLLAVRDGSDAANSWDPRRAREDVDAMRASGRNVALLFHGSEVRRPREHVRLTPWSPFYQAQTHVLSANLERTTGLVHEALADFDGPVLVSTPDLLDHVPGAVWLPVVVGPASFASAAPPLLTGRRLVVAHAPSRSWLKGSEWIDPVLQRMDQQGLLTYRRVQNFPPIMMPSLLREVDVVIDQIVLGGVGVLTAQALAAGRLVLAHLSEPVRRRFPDPPPVVETTPATIEQILLSVIENPEHYCAIAARGVDFARKYHDGRMSADVLTTALSS
ncbi:MAG TPA: hypothetical protein VIL87_09620 [Dermatophilaceae bacterium]|jgi:hypothetical protein